MSQVVDITDRTPNADLVAQLENLLAQAKSGELRSCLLITGWADDCFSHQWCKDHRNTWKRMVGEIALAQTDFHMCALRDKGSYLDRIVDGEE